MNNGKNSKNKSFEKFCSFCGRPKDSVEKLFISSDNSICNRCVELCNLELKRMHQEDIVPKHFVLPKPQELKEHLDAYVIGQDRAKKSLAVAVYNHYKRILFPPRKDNDVELEKANVLLIGPTGTGKTLLAETMAKILKVPFTIADATVLTEAGYVGEDVENVLVRLLQAADYDVARAERGIVYIDEIDKVSRKDSNPSITRDVSGEGVQQALLKILEGTISSVPPRGGRKHPEQPLVQVNTKNILFICGGAFIGLEKIIQRRIGKKVLGFHAPTVRADAGIGELLSQVSAEDIINYGIIPEMVGRLPLIASLTELSNEAMKQILLEPKNAIVRQYQRFFEMEGIELEFTDEALDKVVELTQKRGTGARALRAVMEEAMLEIMYEAPNYKGISRCIITPEVIIDGAEPELVKEKKKRKKSA
ncbi:MAG: ATP-dependent Clp protease ATP-binding subunit ClpX [candidate division Zixibacteria bacterium]|nr:ATP-dependent Clp protease ATP-binding subunit ClpX [candidate division Zixibacteria bacterium]